PGGAPRRGAPRAGDRPHGPVRTTRQGVPRLEPEQRRQDDDLPLVVARARASPGRPAALVGGGRGGRRRGRGAGAAHPRRGVTGTAPSVGAATPAGAGPSRLERQLHTPKGRAMVTD